MTFQTSVSTQMAFGVPGELFLGGPHRAQPGIIDSTGATNPNRVGRAFTQVPGVGNDGHCTVGGTGTFFGWLFNPKVYASRGTVADGTLAPSLDLPQYSEGEFCYDATGLIVSLPAAANIGDLVYYDTTTGAPSTSPASYPASGAQRVAFASNVATVSLAPAGMPPIGNGTVLTSADGQQAIVSAVLTGTGGNGTYTVSTVADHAAQAFSIAKAAAPAGKARAPGWEVVRYSIDAAGVAVIGVVN